MSSTLRVYDHNCRPLTDLNAPTTPRSWVLSDVGRAEFSLSMADAKCTETNLQYGNLIHVEHIPSKDSDSNENGKLPDWVGLILPPRQWDLGVLHATAYTAEVILSFRPMPFVTLKGTPADMFRQIIGFANDFSNNIPIQLGVIENAPGTFSDDLRLSALEHIKTLVTRAQMDFDVTAQIGANGNLQLFANLYARKGNADTFTLNNSNTELAAPLLIEQGTPTNIVNGYSQEATPQKRAGASGVHIGAVGDYGPLGVNKTFTGLHDGTSVHTAAQAQAELYGRPRKVFGRTALDIRDTFSHINTGNRVNVYETNAGFKPGGGFGFNTQARILSVSFNELSLKCPLNLEIS